MQQSIAIRPDATRTVLWLWFAGGAAAWLLIPALRERSELFGWMLPFWLIAAPALDLLLLDRSRLMTASRALLVRARRRRRHAPKTQARRTRHRRLRLRPLLTGLFNP